MRNSFSLSVLFLAAVLLISGCVPSKESQENEEDAKVIPAERLIKKLEANRRKIRTFEGTGIIDVESPQITAKASFEVQLKKPDTIKFSVYGPFGIDLARALVTGDEFVFYDVMQNRVYSGSNKGKTLQNIFKINISFEDLMDAFAGSVNLTDKLRSTPNNYKQDDDGFQISYINEGTGSISRYYIKDEDLSIRNYVLADSKNNPVFEGNYYEFRDFEGVAIPYKVIVENKDENQKVTIEYRNIVVNEEIGDLKINLPDDVKKEEN